MKRRSRWLGLLAAIGLAFAMTSSVAAYHGQTVKIVIVSPSQRTFTCGHWYTVKATVRDKRGRPIRGVPVHWSFAVSRSHNDKITPKTSYANRHGWAYTKVKFGCKPGDRRIKARAGRVNGYAWVHVRIPRHRSTTTSSTAATGSVLGVTSFSDPGSLPSTSTLAPDVSTASTDGLPTPAIPAMLAVLAGVALILRRLALSRR